MSSRLLPIARSSRGRTMTHCSCNTTGGSVLERLATAIAPTDTLHERREAWEGRHMVIRHDACRQLGKVPVPKQHCFYAGRCVCEEPGMSLKQFIDRVGWSMTHAIDAAGSQANKARRKALFKGADIVLRFQWPAPPGNAAPDALHESWYHLALLYDTPTRPTFVTMTRYPDIDYADCIGLDTATVPGALQLHAVWGSAYDALGDVCS